MPKLDCSKLKSLVKEFQKEGIVTDGTIVKCQYCDCVLTVTYEHQRYPISQHVSGARHRTNVTRESKATIQSQAFIGPSFAVAKEQSQVNKQFSLDLTSAFLQSGIPLNKVNTPPLKQFLEKYMHRSVPDESTLRKNYVEPVYDATMSKIRQEIGDNDLAFILDETTDELQRYVLNILVMPLNGMASTPVLIKVILKISSYFKVIPKKRFWLSFSVTYRANYCLIC